MLMTIKIWIPSHQQREFFQACQEIILDGRAEKGCRCFVIQKDLEVEELYLVVTEWNSMEDIESYARTQSFGTLLGASRVLGNDIDLRISKLIPVGGMETINNIRNRGRLGNI